MESSAGAEQRRVQCSVFSAVAAAPRRSSVFLSSLICLIKVNTLVVKQRKHTRTHVTHFLCCNS